MNWLRTLSACVLLFAAFSCMALAQTDEEDKQEIPTFKSNVNVVSLFFDVKDKKGRFVPGLTQDDFQIFEDGQLQRIKFFNADTNVPLAIGILIDTSLSQSQVLSMEQEIGAAFLRNVLHEQDLAFVLNFDLDATLMQDLTHSPDELRAALRAVKINAPMCNGIPTFDGGPDPVKCRGGTVLYDAIYLASEEKLKAETGRKAMVVLTDGQDEGSKKKIRDAIEAAQEANSVVYVLLITDEDFYGRYGYTGEAAMRRIADETGGRVIHVGNNDQKLKEAFQQIAAEMRSQYGIGYTPTNHAQDGTFRQIEIKTKPIYQVQARTGYYAPKPKE